MKGQAQHKPVATLQPHAEIDEGRVAVHRTKVDRAFCGLVVALRLAAVVIAVELDLQHPGVGRRMPLQAAEQRGRSAEHRTQVCRAACGNGVAGTGVEPSAQQGQRVAHIAPRAQIAPAQTEAGVPVAPAFSRHQVFAREKTSATEVAHAQRKLWPSVGLFAQADLDVDRFVLVGLVARNAGAVQPVRDAAVAEPGLQPVEWLQHDIAAGVGLHVADVQAHGPG